MMKIRPLLVLVLMMMMMACEKENYLRLDSSDIILELLPDYSKTKEFRSNTNDTIEIAQMSFNRYYIKTSGDLNNGGSLPSFEYIETERIEQTLGSNDPYFRFDLTLETIYNPTLVHQTEDYLNIRFTDEEGEVKSEMKFSYIDTLQCISPRCAFIEGSMKLQYRSFNDLYITMRDSVNRTAIYWSKNNGLIGFKTSNNKIYELIP